MNSVFKLIWCLLSLGIVFGSSPPKGTALSTSSGANEAARFAALADKATEDDVVLTDDDSTVLLNSLKRSKPRPEDEEIISGVNIGVIKEIAAKASQRAMREMHVDEKVLRELHIDMKAEKFHTRLNDHTGPKLTTPVSVVYRLKGVPDGHGGFRFRELARPSLGAEKKRPKAMNVEELANSKPLEAGDLEMPNYFSFVEYLGTSLPFMGSPPADTEKETSVFLSEDQYPKWSKKTKKSPKVADFFQFREELQGKTQEEVHVKAREECGVSEKKCTKECEKRGSYYTKENKCVACKSDTEPCPTGEGKCEHYETKTSPDDDGDGKKEEKCWLKWFHRQKEGVKKWRDVLQAQDTPEAGKLYWKAVHDDERHRTLQWSRDSYKPSEYKHPPPPPTPPTPPPPPPPAIVFPSKGNGRTGATAAQWRANVAERQKGEKVAKK